MGAFISLKIGYNKYYPITYVILRYPIILNLKWLNKTYGIKMSIVNVYKWKYVYKNSATK